MELRHLRYFVAVAEELHFGKAARRLHLSQPPLSQQIRALEDELGLKLLERTRRKVDLTEAGRLFLPEARRVLAQAEQAMRIAKEASAGKRGRLDVGFVTSAAYSILPGLIRNVRREMPDLDLGLREMNPARQLEALDRGEIHAGLLRLPLAECCLASAIVLDEPLLAALPVDHRLAARKKIDLHQLRDDPFILFRRSHGPGLHDTVMRLCAGSGFSPRVAHETDEMQSVLAYVAGGLGVSLVPRSLTSFHRDHITYRPFKPTGATAPLALVWRRDAVGPLLDRFLSVAKETGAAFQKQLIRVTPARSRVG